MSLQRVDGLERLTYALERQLEVRVRTAVHLLDQYQPDLAVIVFTETDRLHHYFWPCLDEKLPCPPQLQCYRAWARDFYGRLDEALGRIAAVMGEETIRIVMSDHGFGPSPTRQFYANAWLRDLGLLRVRTTSFRAAPSSWLSKLGFSQASLHRLLSRFLPRHQVRRLRIAWGQQTRLPIDWERTQAYLMPLFESVGGIVINLPLDRTAYEELRETLIDSLRELAEPETGLHIVKEAYRREELYEGPYANRAPDLVFILDSRYINDRSLLTQTHFGAMANASRHWTGTHRPEGIFMIVGQPVQSGGRADSPRIEDLAPTILYLLGLPVPQEMDGRVLDEILRSDYSTAHPVRYAKDRSMISNRERYMSRPEDEMEITERLRSLGYLE